MSSSNEAGARHLAALGAEAIAKVQALVDRATELLPELADESTTSAGGKSGIEPFDWEIAEIDPTKERDIWMAVVEDGATGQGITGHFVAGLFRDEAEVRRQLSVTVGRHLANAARVSTKSAPLGSVAFWVSPFLMQAFEDMLDEAQGPGIGVFLAQFHQNYS